MPKSEEEKRRSRISSMKRLIVAYLLLGILIPILLCILLFIKVDRLQKELDQVQRQIASQQSESTAGAEQTASAEADAEAGQQAGGMQADNSLAKWQAEETEPDDGQKRKVYLTFDDGPSSLTEKYLDILKKHKIHATFFLIGQQVEEMPEIVERELKEGHEIGVHTYTHESCEIYASCQAYYEDVNKVRDVLEKRFDYKPQLWRFPWGSANCYIHSYKEEIIQRLGEQNMEYADWNVSAEDSVGSPTVDSILRNVKKDAFRVKDPVVLMHDSGSNQATLDSLEAVITLFEEQGYRFETMSQRENCCHFGQ